MWRRPIGSTWKEFIYCEELGFEGVFVNEHHFTYFSLNPSSTPLAAALIAKTERMKVGVMGHVLPLRHPVHTAEEFAQLDCLSGGRFIGGIVRGVPQELISYNVDPFTSRERFAESYDIVKRCLSEELFDYEGKFYNLRAVSVWPKPIQNPLPIWMPAGSAETIEFAAERHIPIARVWNPTAVFQDAFEYYKDVAREQFGWEATPEYCIGSRYLHVAETNEQADRGMPRGRDVRAAADGVQPAGADAGAAAWCADGPQLRLPEALERRGDASAGDAVREAAGVGLHRVRRPGLRGGVASQRHGDGWVRPLPGDVPVRQAEARERDEVQEAVCGARDARAGGGKRQLNQTIIGRRQRTWRAGLGGNLMPLPLYDGANHVLDQDSPEITRFIQETRDGMAVGGWELAVPQPGPDGNPFLFIFVGPTAEHRGSGLRLHMASTDGGAIPDTAQVLVESFYKSGSERQAIFAGEYGEFSAIANQEDPDASLSAQRRVESGEDYLVRVKVSVPEGGPAPDPTAAGSDFHIDCVKIWWTESA